MSPAMAVAAPRAQAAVRQWEGSRSNSPRKRFLVPYGEVRQYRGMKVACEEGCHLAPVALQVTSRKDGEKHVVTIGERPLLPVMPDHRLGYVFQVDSLRGYRFVWRGGVGQFLAGHPRACVCAISRAPQNGGGCAFREVNAEEQRAFETLAALEITVDDARSAGIANTSCAQCSGSHTTMRRSGAVGILIGTEAVAFLDEGCLSGLADCPRPVSFISWAAAGKGGTLLRPAILPAPQAVVERFWAAHRMTPLDCPPSTPPAERRWEFGVR